MVKKKKNPVYYSCFRVLSTGLKSCGYVHTSYTSARKHLKSKSKSGAGWVILKVTR